MELLGKLESHLITDLPLGESQISNQKSTMLGVDGVLIIDKPAGMTSHDVVARVRKILGERRVGHTGTLDPFATGVLVVLIGRATRLAQFLSGAEKEYEAVIRLGFATDTGDVTGKRLEHTTETQRRSFTADEIEAVLARFRGEIEQTPPMFSAKKVAGKKLYELARRGEEIERKSVRVTISEFALVSGPRPNGDTCDLTARVVCSAGTYVRTLAEDFGKGLGAGAHVAELRRTRAGMFRVEDALTLDQLAQDSAGLLLISPDAALSHLPFVDLDEDGVRRVQHGTDLPMEGSPEAGPYVRLRDPEGNLIAVGIYDDTRQTLHPEVVISTAN